MMTIQDTRLCWVPVRTRRSWRSCRWKDFDWKRNAINTFRRSKTPKTPADRYLDGQCACFKAMVTTTTKLTTKRLCNIVSRWFYVSCNRGCNSFPAQMCSVQFTLTTPKCLVCSEWLQHQCNRTVWLLPLKFPPKANHSVIIYVLSREKCSHCYSNAESMQNDQVHCDKQYITC